ncbi:YebC/PmpR family DNA-binding transcriptional regulator [Candidatus Falkowbacteria bacterium]|nr:YebC/PmpR family DNA-binding transcriptional regulator [Candidatus Falkowbacteria bacterium]MBT7348585.1 YebC/PmpR family DNA-binding transcriptional regulator [Candidatus Falkowbacteria bacterium]MBT7500375.1 YebC/PmpR family DNA-binding transcriptional regulator [Candidatus Falkowbacteria bacterium]
MSGHSKWDKIHRQKGATDAARGNLFTKLSRNISVAARGGGDPDMNFSLKIAIDKAKASNMPKDKIENAIKRGTGELGGAVIEEVLYEAYGPGGMPLLIEGVTDNKNRTTPEVKAILTKNGGSLGAQNSVKWMFEHKGVIRVDLAKLEDKDELMMEVIDLGADDVEEEEGGLTIETSFSNFEKVRKELENKSIKLDYAEMEWVAKDKQEVNEQSAEKIERIMDLLEAHDDVNGVYTNIE